MQRKQMKMKKKKVQNCQNYLQQLQPSSPLLERQLLHCYFQQHWGRSALAALQHHPQQMLASQRPQLMLASQPPELAPPLPMVLQLLLMVQLLTMVK